jgi:hypothetical protein
MTATSRGRLPRRRRLRKELGPVSVFAIATGTTLSAGFFLHEGFMASWREARNEQVLKEILLRDERYLSLRLRPDGPAAERVGRALCDLDLPPGTLVALVHRRGEIVVPRGSTVLRGGDRLTILGGPEEVAALRRRYGRGGGDAP